MEIGTRTNVRYNLHASKIHSQVVIRDAKQYRRLSSVWMDGFYTVGRRRSVRTVDIVAHFMPSGNFN